MSMQLHSPEDRENMARFAEEMLGMAERQWPNKRISADDDGSTSFAIAVDPRHKIIRIQFTKPMNWVGLDMNAAVKLKEMLESKIRELEIATP